MGKFGRKICCNFDNNAKCILLIEGNKRCVLNETTEEQHENGKVQFSICPLLPESERDGFLAEMEKKGYVITSYSIHYTKLYDSEIFMAVPETSFLFLKCSSITSISE